MQQVMRKVKLYGKMGSLFGREHTLAVKSTSEAIKALCVTIPGFEKYMMKSKEAGLTFAVFNGKNNIGEGELEFNGTKDIRIAPVPIGNKRNGLFQTIIGVVLVAVGYIASPFTGGASLALVAPGVALAAGGIIQMLSPQPKSLDSREEEGNKPSANFGGAVNTVAMGQPLGILCGERVIGGSIASAGIYASDAV